MWRTPEHNAIVSAHRGVVGVVQVGVREFMHHSAQERWLRASVAMCGVEFAPRRMALS